MQSKETKKIRKTTIYWILSSILFLVDGVFKALPAYHNPTLNRLLPHLQQAIETPVLINQNYLVWVIASFAGLASIIFLIFIIWRPLKNKDIYFLGLIPLGISIVALIYGKGTFWGIVAIIFNIIIAWNSLGLTGRIKQLTDWINRTIFKNTKIVTGIIWSFTTTVLILDAVLRAFPEGQTDGIYEIARGVIDLIGAGFILLSILLFSDKISKRIKFYIGVGPIASTALAFLIGYPVSMTSIWMWIAIIFSILTLAQFGKLFGEIKDIPKFNLKMNGLFWTFASAVALVNVINNIFPLYNIQHKALQLGWAVSETLLALSILIPLPIYIYDTMKSEEINSQKGIRKLLSKITTDFQDTRFKLTIWLSLIITAGIAIGWDIIYNYRNYLWSSVPTWRSYNIYLIPIIFDLINGLVLCVLLARVIFNKKNSFSKNSRIDQIVSTLPLVLSLANLILFLKLEVLSIYYSCYFILLLSLGIFILNLKNRKPNEPKTKKWMMMVVGSIPLLLAAISFVNAIQNERIEIWSWLSLVSGLLATLFAFFVTGNPNNQTRRVKKFGKTWKVFKKNWMGVTGLILLVVIVILAVGGSRLTKWDPDAYYSQDRLQAPSRTHILGTNRYGQDVFTVLLDSLGISLLIGIVAGSLTVIVGTTIGVASAYIGGWVDNVIMRITDVILVMPALPLMLVLASLPFLFGKVHWSVIAVVYIVVFWPVSARLIRGQALSVKERAFVTSAKSSGAGSGYIIFKHILPNVFPLMLTMIITSMRQAILYESFLSYLGLGDPLNWTLGQMLYIAQNQAAFASGAWWMFFPPGIAIGLITLSFAFIGMALDEIVNPRLRKR